MRLCSLRKIRSSLIVAELSSQFKCLPNGDPITGVPCCGSSPFPERQSLEKSLSPARPYSCSGSLVRDRTRSPAGRHPASAVLGYKFGWRGAPALICPSTTQSILFPSTFIQRPLRIQV